MPPELVSLSEGPNILLDKPIVLLGRHHECDIQLNSRKVSRRHCCIAQVNDYLVVRDLCSTNGIRINGEKVAEGHLSPGDELTVGNFQFRIHWFGHPDQPISKENGSAEKKISGSAEAPPAQLVGTEGDASLESCEEPVPLAESSMDRKLDELAKEPAEAPDEESKSAAAAADSNASQMVDQPPSLILPEHLDLVPKSDEIKEEEDEEKE